MTSEPSSESVVSALILSNKGQQGFAEWSSTSKARIDPSSAKLLRDDIRETLEFADFPNSPFCISFLRTLLSIADDNTLCEVCNVALYSAEKGASVSSLLPIDKSEVSPLSQQDDTNFTALQDDDDDDENNGCDDDDDENGTSNNCGYCMLNDDEDNDDQCEWEANFDDDDDDDDDGDIVPPQIDESQSNNDEEMKSDVKKECDGMCEMTTPTLPHEALVKLQVENNKVIDSIELLIKNFELELLLKIEEDDEATLDNDTITSMFCALNDEVEKMESDPKAKENVYAGSNKVFSRFANKPLMDVRDDITSDLRDILYDELVMVRAAKAASGTAQVVPRIESNSSLTAATKGSESSVSFTDDE